MPGAGQQVPQQEDTFTQTMVVNSVFVLVALLLFGTLKLLFPSYYMPLVQSGKRNWLRDVFATPLDRYARQGNMPLVFIAFQALLIKTMCLLLAVALLVISPAYYMGNNQDRHRRSFWSAVQITNVEEGSLLTLVPVAACVLVCVYTMEFYREFSLIHAHYKQLVLRRAAPSNYCVMLDCLPPGLQSYRRLRETLAHCFPNRQLKMIVPVPLNNNRLYAKYRALRRTVLREQELLSMVYEQRAGVRYLQVRLQQTGRGGLGRRLHRAQRRLEAHKQAFYRQQLRSRRLKQQILRLCQAEGIDIGYMRGVDQLHPPFPGVVDSFRLIDKAEPDRANPVPVAKLERRNRERRAFYAGAACDGDEDRHIGPCCFCIFQSQKDASMAAQACLFPDNTEPRVAQAPHFQDIVWQNVGARKGTQMLFACLYWAATLALLFLYFVPQYVITRYIGSRQAGWFDEIYGAMCAGPLGCKTGVQPSGEKPGTLGSASCYICYTISAMSINYLVTIVQALFLTMLPVILRAMARIPKLKTQTQRDARTFVCLFAFLFIFQGVLDAFFGTAVKSDGVLYVEGLFSSSVNEMVQKIAQNIASQSFVFLNYVATRYFFFNVFDLLRVRHIFPTLWRVLTARDLLTKAQVFKYDDYNYVVQLCYLVHMVVVGLMYAVISPATVPVIFVAMGAMMLVGRYNILFVYHQNAMSDMSGQDGIFQHAATMVFIGAVLSAVVLLCYILVRQSALAPLCAPLLLLLVVCICVWQRVVDQRFGKSARQLKLGDFEDGRLQTNELINKLKAGGVSYATNISLLGKQHLAVRANPESLHNYILSEREVQDIAADYTNPAVAVVAVYPREDDDWFIL